jgi:hypothetical protein
MYITNIYLMFDSNSLLTYLFWSPTKTINFFEYSWLIDIKSVRSNSHDFVCLKRVMAFNQHILPS